MLLRCFSCPALPPGRVTETPWGAHHFRQPFVTLIGCLYPHLAMPFGLFDRLSPRLEACFPAQAYDFELQAFWKSTATMAPLRVLAGTPIPCVLFRHVPSSHKALLGGGDYLGKDIPQLN